jgi:hypothetical protein
MLDAPDSVRKACRAQFANDNQAALCIRTSMAGLALGRLLADLGGEKMPDFDTPDTHKVPRTDDDHPAAQCRLDTYYAGSLCGVDFQKDTSDTDPTVNTCSQEKGDKIGYRPRCWYAPQDNNLSHRDPDPRRAYHGHYY